MPDDERLTWDLIFEVLDVLGRHGYRRSDNQHAGQVIGLINDVTHIYEGTLDASSTPYVVVPSSRPVAPHPPGVIVSTGQSCSTCQWRVQAADVYDRLADRMSQAAEASAAQQRPPPRGASPRRSARGRRTGGRTVSRRRTALAPCTAGQPRRMTA